ncbi:uncharacterized protein LOC102156858 isoform X10 [Canis lupus familiaris]|uniref:uncharacterized protein LOC102156858 isoform X10 n=1 Tax=Canis lupus familiaris TaxID=9615 RepID=UPI0018F2BD47|nr:uncharacterized protein LOC102156858 isoform X10 [Canis lupus familiaris]
MSESKKGTAGGRDGKTTNNMTLPDKQPCLTPPFLLLPQTRSVLRVLSPEGQEYAAECLESISVLPVPQPHTGRPLPGEITSPCCHCHRRRLRDHEPLQTPTQFSGIERMHTLLHNYHHHPFPGLFPSSKLCLAIDGQEQPPTNPILSSSEKGQRS